MSCYPETPRAPGELLGAAGRAGVGPEEAETPAWRQRTSARLSTANDEAPYSPGRVGSGAAAGEALTGTRGGILHRPLDHAAIATSRPVLCRFSSPWRRGRRRRRGASSSGPGGGPEGSGGPRRRRGAEAELPCASPAVPPSAGLGKRSRLPPSGGLGKVGWPDRAWERSPEPVLEERLRLVHPGTVDGGRGPGNVRDTDRLELCGRPPRARARALL